MNQVEKAARFAELHVKGTPLLLYNAWDAGTAKSILDAGAKAIATSSWAVAEAQGYRDGEAIPITLVEQIIARIVSTIDAPVSADFEGGYSDDNGVLAENVAKPDLDLIKRESQGCGRFSNVPLHLARGS